MEVVIDDDSKIYALLTEGIPRFQEEAEVFISDRLKRMRVNSTPKISVGISLSGELLEFTLDSGELSMEQLAEILSKYDRKAFFPVEKRSVCGSAG